MNLERADATPTKAHTKGVYLTRRKKLDAEGAEQDKEQRGQ